MKSSPSLILLICSLFLSCNGNGDSGTQASGQPDQLPVYEPAVYAEFPHDAEVYTQGLVYEEGSLYESAGLYDPFPLRQVEIESGSIIRETDLNSEYFNEGITLCGDRIILLTWQSRIGFVYDKETFQLIESFNYETEGWGITYDGEYLIMSDGTDVLYYLEPDEFSIVKQVSVTAEGVPVTELNELEYIDGRIYANVYQTDRIAIIQPDGEVVGWIDLEGLLPSGECARDMDVLNGIAYNDENDSMYVTGKYGCKLFELEIVP